ncbi:MAG: AfsR/SARP family transcriptional regulator, partial [Acidimicrobiales bacterium]|nr:AfsR/SARP family transcriptional regulator [Acidimicrobiales bacterium]
MRVNVLGEVAATDHVGNRVELRGDTSLRILAHLAAVHPGSADAEVLIESGWPGVHLEAPRPSLRMTISRLRRSLSPDPNLTSIHNDATGYRLDERVRVDARTFDTELDLCRQAADDEEVADRLAAALELWRGEPYGGLDGSLFEAERQRLTRLRVEAIERRQGALIRLGRAADGLDQLERACAAHPLHEGLVGLLMHSLHAAGEQAGALSVYETTRRRLLD